VLALAYKPMENYAVTMSLQRYVFIMFIVYLAYFWGVIEMLGGPTIAAPHTANQLPYKITLGAFCMAVATLRLASWTPTEKRTDFLSYRTANFAFIFLLGLTVYGYFAIKP